MLHSGVIVRFFSLPPAIFNENRYGKILQIYCGYVIICLGDYSGGFLRRSIVGTVCFIALL